MDEYETNPQRHEASSPEERSHPNADGPRDTGQPERGQSDRTSPATSSTPHPAPIEPATAQQAPVPPTSHQSVPHPPAQQPFAPQPTAQQPAVPAPQSSPWQSGLSQQYPGQPQPGQPQPGQYHPGQTYPGQSYAGQHHPGQYPGQPQQPGTAGYSGQPAAGAWSDAAQTGTGSQLPIWASSVDTDQREPRTPGRGRKMLLTGAAAVLLALMSGGVGAVTALALDDNGSTITATKSSSTPVTRVVDRSSLAEIASSVQDSVVSITTGSGEGSGVVLSADGYVLTNNHVVATAQGNRVNVVFANGKSAQATIVGTDPRTDLAVVKADGVTDLKPATFGSSAAMKVGDTVLALGSPLGLEGSVTSGIISAKDRTIQAGGEDQQPNPFGGQQQSTGTTSMSGLLQTDAPINPGNSGGALVNVAGEVIGINSAIATSGQGAGNIGLGFAIPSDKAKDVADQLRAGKKVSHPALGVTVAEVEGGGAAINSVTANSGAAKAGLQRGDIVTQVNGKPINDSDDLVSAIQAGKVGDQVTVTYTRNGAQKTTTATLTEAP
jgi:putative serine protease PepD